MGARLMETVVADLRVFGLDFAEGEDKDEIAEKLEELCALGRASEQNLGDELIAFAVRKGIVLLTLESLQAFEQEALSKRAMKHPRRREADHWLAVEDTRSGQEPLEVEEEDEDLLDAYTSPSKAAPKRSISTPEDPQSKRTHSSRSPRLAFSPSSFSPRATPSQTYRSRRNCGEVVSSFGDAQSVSWRGTGASASVRLFDPQEALTKPYKCMFQDLMEYRNVLCDKIEDIGDAMKKHYEIEEFSSLSVPVQEPVTVLGQIGCDSNGKLNAQSVILEGDREHSCGDLVPVDISELGEYSLFPGQVVVMEGINTTGKRLVASRLFEGIPLPFHKPEVEPTDLEPRMVLLACGPYTTLDSIAYEPMLDLIDVINKDKPDLCILLGPFLDAKHKQVEEGHLLLVFEEVFRKCLKMIVEGTRSAGSFLVIVPSLRDVHHTPVYPQPPFTCDLSKDDRQRVLFVSNPCTLEVNGTVIGLTSMDLLFHMGAEEISRSTSLQDRFSRILKHILTQRSYYPLYPPPEDVNVDYENFFPHLSLPVTPDVLVTPSELKHFVKDVLGCVCVNPGRLTKGQVGGTYGRLWLQQQDSGAERKSPCLAAQVVRI